MLILKYQTGHPWQMLAHSQVPMSNEVYEVAYSEAQNL